MTRATTHPLPMALPPSAHHFDGNGCGAVILCLRVTRAPCSPLRRKCPVPNAKEVGMGDPAEKTSSTGPACFTPLPRTANSKVRSLRSKFYGLRPVIGLLLIARGPCHRLALSACQPFSTTPIRPLAVAAASRLLPHLSPEYPANIFRIRSRADRRCCRQVAGPDRRASPTTPLWPSPASSGRTAGPAVSDSSTPTIPTPNPRNARVAYLEGGTSLRPVAPGVSPGAFPHPKKLFA